MTIAKHIYNVLKYKQRKIKDKTRHATQYNTVQTKYTYSNKAHGGSGREQQQHRRRHQQQWRKRTSDDGCGVRSATAQRSTDAAVVVGERAECICGLTSGGSHNQAGRFRMTDCIVRSQLYPVVHVSLQAGHLEAARLARRHIARNAGGLDFVPVTVLLLALRVKERKNMF